MTATVWTVAKSGVWTPEISVGRWLFLFSGLLFRLLRCRGRFASFLACSVAFL